MKAKVERGPIPAIWPRTYVDALKTYTYFVHGLRETHPDTEFEELLRRLVAEVGAESVVPERGNYQQITHLFDYILTLDIDRCNRGHGVTVAHIGPHLPGRQAQNLQPSPVSSFQKTNIINNVHHICPLLLHMVFAHDPADPDIAEAIRKNPWIEEGTCHFPAVLLTWHFDAFHIHRLPVRMSPLRVAENVKDFYSQVMAQQRHIYREILNRQPALRVNNCYDGRRLLEQTNTAPAASRPTPLPVCITVPSDLLTPSAIYLKLSSGATVEYGILVPARECHGEHQDYRTIQLIGANLRKVFTIITHMRLPQTPADDFQAAYDQACTIIRATLEIIKQP
ncbi:hypothetical protein C7999DRAFT_35886 [Corynascus novoguineensis]|uniref:Uncharacterized protein n=1 Tax=Corynascus novoguineensis TaxID=1126955 RepID=A0AAN7CKK0_9PEZI|nr:hypothetical protein C7999DRAFT_35886 [Corynascus novoguineensis]